MQGKKLFLCALALTSFFANSPGMGDEAKVTMKPLMAASHASGSKHILSFFVSRDGVCNLTLMVSELENSHPEETGSRVLVALDPFKSTRLDIADGKSLEFVCEQSAAMMTVWRVDRISYLEKM
ncbi:hypothetical protein OGR47_20315 (plasmid) [Methylocystis sp. MJC1]|uniref:hypothetical protein n=1 Tax=Methylocystis sp. MJC1 TaxID=2654282 RepID=UPI0013EC205D|nr:hypothetical protein [Methylocystis sp. MJC1]KAF2988985.1 hypothetical protein MJC1_03945 [Methylocystis sp. MJC1]MBU6529254.1 hypothetical protein [Methylocystis sp. MJC1]UZX13928.1 hypothetical protein OGR47_20315 [Methylocystis sp. MJC1]